MASPLEKPNSILLNGLRVGDSGRVGVVQSDTKICNNLPNNVQTGSVAKVTRSPRFNNGGNNAPTSSGGLLLPPTLFLGQKGSDQKTSKGFLLQPPSVPLSAPSSPPYSERSEPTMKTKRTFGSRVKVLRAFSVGGVVNQQQHQQHRSPCFSQHLLLQAASENNSQKMKFILSTSKSMNVDICAASIQPLSSTAPPPQNEYGPTPLYHLVKNKNLEMIELLLAKYGASPDYPIDDDETTSLMHSETIEIAALLIRYGARPDMKNKAGKTAVDFAIERNNQELVQFLQRSILEELGGYPARAD